ncbi:uncharacterized protein [Lolium perenne]|uniref:uncharacterized protein n=1 Tax=Lolium perenne TaxID=4522 RepID=UPI003A995F21
MFGVNACCHVGVLVWVVFSLVSIYLYLPLLNQQMPPRRVRTGTNNTGNNNPNPDVQLLINAQAQLMQTMNQFIANQNQNNNHHNNNNNPPPGVDMLTRFLRLRPAKFSTAPEPMIALDWLRAVDKDLVTVGCTEAEKVRFAAHLLEGPAASWWDNYQITHPLAGITWEMFQEGFRTAHVSTGVMTLKRREFRNLRQNHRTVAEYIEEFSNLARYAPEDVDTDAKRKERFLDGLHDDLAVQLSIVHIPDFQTLLDKATILEGKQKQAENRKRKHSNNHNNSAPHQRTRTFHDGNGNSGQHKHGGSGHNHHGGKGHQHKGGNGHHHNGQKHLHHNSGRGNGLNNGDSNGRNRPNNFTGRDISQVECFKCRKTGHYASDCPEKKDVNAKPTPFQKGHVNHVNVEEVYEEPDAVIDCPDCNECDCDDCLNTDQGYTEDE